MMGRSSALLKFLVCSVFGAASRLTKTSLPYLLWVLFLRYRLEADPGSASDWSLLLI